MFDAIFQHVVNPPASPVAEHVSAFVDWTANQLLDPVNIFSAYPDVTVKDIKAMAMAAAADVTAAGVLNPFLVILNAKSRLAFMEMKLLLRARTRGTQKDLEKVGTPHFAQFPLKTTRSGSLPCMTGRSISTSRISPKILAVPSTWSSSSSPAHPLRLAGNTPRNSSITRPERTAPQLVSIEPTRG